MNALNIADLGSSGVHRRVAPPPATPGAVGPVGREPLRKALRERPRQRGCCCRVFAWLFRE